jgi:hypothetical protein
MRNLLFIVSIVLFLQLESCQNNSNPVSDSKADLQSNQFAGSWLQPNPINENESQGFVLKSDGTAQSINMATLLYKEWWVESNKLVLVMESIGNRASSVDTIKYEVLLINDKELKLKDGELIDEYKRK